MPMNMPEEMPVYLFTGFLDAGKTTFIQDALESRDFMEDEQTLLLLCEDGEIEYEPERFYSEGGEKVAIVQIEEEDDLSTFLLSSLVREHKPTRVIIEWNGMWSLSSLYENMPLRWNIYQQVMLVDSTTFLMYNTNIRQQTFEQLRDAEMVAFNRCKRDDKFGDWQQEAHRICRVANRKSQIIYEFGPNDILMDDIQDPLPYDMSKNLLAISDEDYAEWYRDLNERQDEYEGKEIIIKGRAVVGGEMPPGKFIFGRHVMTCCEADIQFAGLLCRYDEKKVSRLTNGQWVEIRARVKCEYDPIYEEAGPVLYCSNVTKVDPCQPEVATF